MGKLHQEDVRSKIQASQLVNRLSDHVLGKVELTATQVQAARVLLAKTLPDLTAVEMSGDPDSPVNHRIEMVVVDANGQG